ncbi:MAG: ATP-grasp domain-containing protein [Clostridia bacterium]|nr:ATP-grasp domain-containing protein [Clostridia bacterium]
MGVEGKRLLVLGGTSATLDLVRNAKEMGIYTIVTDYLEGGVAKEIADETAMVSTADLEGLEVLVKERKVDGVFCGPSEFNIRNLIRLCERTGLPCYTNMELWDRCANKDEFKQYCIDNGVDCPRQFYVDENSTEEELEAVDYPVIVKPVDGHSSNGISVATDKTMIREACRFAMEHSQCKRIVVEKYIENGGELFGARYFLKDGEPYPYLLMDTYVADPVEKRSLISHFTYAPSKYSDYYMKNMDQQVRQMLKNMGLKNGTAFFQALPCNGKIYFHEMGYRLSGGMLF